MKPSQPLINAYKYKLNAMHFNICNVRKVFMSELSKFCGRQPLKNLKRYIKAVCLPQNVLRPLLNALSHVTV